MSDKLRQQLERFPHAAGVYLFKDTAGRVLYIGKAKNLQRRVQSYLSGRDERVQIAFLLKKSALLECIVTDTEKEALLLENTLIKQHRPRYNADLRDDKAYASIRIGLGHASPGISLTRRIVKDGAAYFGPYASSTAARETVDQLTKFFRIRSCNDREFANRIRPCLKYDIGRCTAPCVGFVAPAVYQEQVAEAILFLKGRNKELVKKLRGQMQQASTELHYEDAAKFRDAIALIEKTLEAQKAVVHGGADYDAIGCLRHEGVAAACLLCVRRGVLSDRFLYRLGEVGGSDDDLLSTFLLQRYLKFTDCPAQILLPWGLEDRAIIAELLKQSAGKKVELIVPQRGTKREMVELARKNAELGLHEAKGRVEQISSLLEGLADRLQMNGPPRTIECLDISNLSGREAVGSLVCFVDGSPHKQRYRTYHIRTLDTPNDYGMMREVLLRRFLHSDLPLPDLLLVDGGKGQLNIALRALEEVRITGLPLAAIAKAEGDEPDRVYLPLRKNPVKLSASGAELLYLMRIRDEAHRFGVKAHQKLRKKVQFF